MKKFSAFLIIIASLSQPLPAASNTMGDMMYTMFRMMLAMANHMAGSFDNSGSFNLGSNFGSGFNPWVSSFPGTWPGNWPGTSSWGSPGFASPWSTMPYSGFPSGPGYGTLPYSQWQNWQRGVPSPYRNYGLTRFSALDGQWQGLTGEIFEVSGNRFRLRSLHGTLSGTIQVDNRHLRLFLPQMGAVMSYRYKRNWSGLTLRDRYGRILVFQRRPFYRFRRY